MHLNKGSLHKLKSDIESKEIEQGREFKNKLLKTASSLQSLLGKANLANNSKYLKRLSTIKEKLDKLPNFSYGPMKETSASRLTLLKLIKDIDKENKRIFIVHGRDHAMREAVRALLGVLKLDAVVLEHEANQGQTIIEKFIRSSRDCEYAIILMSADDVGGLKTKNPALRSRARQNVVLELGYFLHKVGRQNLFILYSTTKDFEGPSDFNGIVYESYDSNGAWKAKLVKELKQASIYFDPKLADRI